MKITVAAYTAQPGDLLGGVRKIAKVHDTYERRVYIWIEGFESAQPRSYERNEPITVVRAVDSP